MLIKHKANFNFAIIHNLKFKVQMHDPYTFWNIHIETFFLNWMWPVLPAPMW